MGNNFISRFQAKLVNHTKRLVSHLEAETGVSPGYKVKSINNITIITTSSIVLIIINIITVITGSSIVLNSTVASLCKSLGVILSST